MALQLSIPNPLDPSEIYSVAYFIIVKIEIDYLNNRADVTLCAWKNEAVRDGNSPGPVAVRFTFDDIQDSNFTTVLDEDTVKQAGNSTRTQIYAWIKTQSNLNGYDFTNATDV